MFIKQVSIFILSIFFVLLSSTNQAQTKKTKKGNPVFEGWYADPEGIIFDDEYWIYPTMSGVYGKPDKPSKLTPEQLEAQSKTINKQYLEQKRYNRLKRIQQDLLYSPKGAGNGNDEDCQHSVHNNRQALGIFWHCHNLREDKRVLLIEQNHNSSKKQALQ